jgi:hypothetical protein
LVLIERTDMAAKTLCKRLRKAAADKRSVGNVALAKLLDDAASAIEPQVIDDADAARWRKVMGLAAYGGTWGKKQEHVWRFRPIMTPHANLNDAIDAMGE